MVKPVAIPLFFEMGRLTAPSQGMHRSSEVFQGSDGRGGSRDNVESRPVGLLYHPSGHFDEASTVQADYLAKQLLH